LLGIAEIFAEADFKKTIHFIAFGGEEQGLFGSQEYVKKRVANGFDVKTALIMDMISFSDDFFGIKLETLKEFSDLTDLIVENVLDDCCDDITRKLSIRKSFNPFGSDHVPFLAAGIPAVLAIERDDTCYPDFHLSTDTFENGNTDQALAITRSIASTLVDLADLD